MLKMYDMILDNHKKVTVISDSISHAIEIAEARGEIVEHCVFLRNIKYLLIDKRILD